MGASGTAVLAPPSQRLAQLSAHDGGGLIVLNDPEVRTCSIEYADPCPHGSVLGTSILDVERLYQRQWWELTETCSHML